jgi:uncharacterized protein (DUF1800 family)
MAGEQKTLHALNRLTFGPRPGDPEVVSQQGLDQWIELQLHPEAIPENPVLEAKLAPLDTLRMSTPELVRHYPTPQMVKAMTNGSQPFPADPEMRYMVRKLVARFQRKEAADKAGQADNAELNATGIPGNWQLDDQQKQVLDNGKPPEQVALLESMPPAEQYDVLDSLRNGPRQKLFASAPPDLRRKIQIFNGPVQVVNQDLTESKLLRAVYSDRQLEEVLTDFWYNHFNVFLDKGADRYMVTSYERDVIRPHVLGRFQDLLLATAESPAMLFYLDNWESQADSNRPRLEPIRAGRPGSLRNARGGLLTPEQQQVAMRRRGGLNENYGRELLELHTLGVDGGYTQGDVINVARALTGWTFPRPQQGGGTFTFNPQMHDAGEKIVLGHKLPAGRGIEDGEDVLDIVARHPATAHYIAFKLVRRFVSDTPPAGLVDRAAATFMRTDGDIREVVRTIITSPEFFAHAAYRSKVKSPFEVVVSALRALGAQPDGTLRTAQTIATLGEPIYGHQAPNGWPETGDQWMNTGAILNRINFGVAIAAGKIPGVSPTAWKGAENLQNASVEKQVDGVVGALLGGGVSPDTRSILITGENPFLASAAALDTTPAMSTPKVPADSDEAMMMLPEPGAGARTRGPARDRAFGKLQPPAKGLALIVGLAIGSPEFQRR